MNGMYAKGAVNIYGKTGPGRRRPGHDFFLVLNNGVNTFFRNISNGVKTFFKKPSNGVDTFIYEPKQRGCYFFLESLATGPKLF